MLEQSIRKYQNRAIEAAQVIEELIALAKDMRQANERGEALELSEDELAFYDALETNDSAVQGARRRDAAHDRARGDATRSARTSPSTGPCARTSAPSCA